MYSSGRLFPIGAVRQASPPAPEHLTWVLMGRTSDRPRGVVERALYTIVLRRLDVKLSDEDRKEIHAVMTQSGRPPKHIAERSNRRSLEDLAAEKVDDLLQRDEALA